MLARPSTGPEKFGPTAVWSRRSIAPASAASLRLSRCLRAWPRPPRLRLDELVFTERSPSCCMALFVFGDQTFPYQEGTFADTRCETTQGCTISRQSLPSGLARPRAFTSKLATLLGHPGQNPSTHGAVPQPRPSVSGLYACFRIRTA